MRTKWFLAFLFLIWASSAVADDLADGVKFFEKGDHKKARELFLRASENGSGAAEYNLGLMYARGEGVLQDYKEAARRFGRAIDRGYTPAKCILASAYAEGLGVEQDPVTARRLAKEGFEAGDSYCGEVWKKYDLGNEEGINNFQKNKSLRNAYEWGREKGSSACLFVYARAQEASLYSACLRGATGQ